MTRWMKMLAGRAPVHVRAVAPYQAASLWSLLSVCVCSFLRRANTHPRPPVRFEMPGGMLRLGGLGCRVSSTLEYMKADQWTPPLWQSEQWLQWCYKTDHKRIQQMQQSNIVCFFPFFLLVDNFCPAAVNSLHSPCSSLSKCFNIRISGKQWQKYTAKQ